MTLNQINKALKERGYTAELVKGKGYFYFVGNGLNCAASTSVMVNSVNQLSIDEWIKECEDLYNRVNKDF